MADIDTCMIQKFVQRAQQIHKIPFDDKEFCPVGLQCFTSNGDKLLFLACFSFQASKAANIGNHNSIHIVLILHHESLNYPTSLVNWWRLIHWAQRNPECFSVGKRCPLLSLRNILKLGIKGY